MKSSTKSLIFALAFYVTGLLITILFFTPGFNGIDLLAVLSMSAGLFFWLRFLHLAQKEEDAEREARFEAHLAEFKRQYGLEFFDQNDEEK